MTARRLHLDREKALDVLWDDGTRTVYPLDLLRQYCPCASCKKEREERAEKREAGKVKLNLMSAEFTRGARAVGAELVGNYALRIDWSDQHGSGIYSFEYLRSLKVGSAG